jgi:hypothetical protein
MTLPASQGDAVARLARGDGLRLELIPDMPSAGLIGRDHLTAMLGVIVDPATVSKAEPTNASLLAFEQSAAKAGKGFRKARERRVATTTTTLRHKRGRDVVNLCLHRFLGSSTQTTHYLRAARLLPRTVAVTALPRRGELVGGWPKSSFRQSNRRSVQFLTTYAERPER